MLRFILSNVRKNCATGTSPPVLAPEHVCRVPHRSPQAKVGGWIGWSNHRRVYPSPTHPFGMDRGTRACPMNPSRAREEAVWRSTAVRSLTVAARKDSVPPLLSNV